MRSSELFCILYHCCPNCAPKKSLQRRAEGALANSRWRSEATPPEIDVKYHCTLAGVQELLQYPDLWALRPVAAPRLAHFLIACTALGARNELVDVKCRIR